MLLLFSHIFECQSIRMSVYAWTFSAFVCLLITVYKRTHFLFLFIFFSLSRIFYFFSNFFTNKLWKKILVFIQHTTFFFTCVYVCIWHETKLDFSIYIKVHLLLYLHDQINFVISLHLSSSCWYIFFFSVHLLLADFFFHIMSVTKNYFFFSQ